MSFKHCYILTVVDIFYIFDLHITKYTVHDFPQYFLLLNLHTKKKICMAGLEAALET